MVEVKLDVKNVLQNYFLLEIVLPFFSVSFACYVEVGLYF